MHELSIATSLVEAAVRGAEEHGAGRIVRLTVRVGTLAGVESDALSFCFPFAAQGTSCEGAALEIVRAPGTGSCAGCGTTTDVSDLLDPCPGCGSWPLSIAGGRDLSLVELEVD